MDQKSHSNGMISVELGNEGKEQPQKPKILLVGINISHMSSTQQLCLLSTGVFFFYLFYGYFQVSYFVFSSKIGKGQYCWAAKIFWKVPLKNGMFLICTGADLHPQTS